MITVCTICDTPIIYSAFVGDGRGDGNRFAHYDCFFSKGPVQAKYEKLLDYWAVKKIGIPWNH